MPTLKQKVGGKSIEMEKFVSARAEKFLRNGNRLVLPVLELVSRVKCSRIELAFIVDDVQNLLCFCYSLKIYVWGNFDILGKNGDLVHKAFEQVKAARKETEQADEQGVFIAISKF